MDQIKIFKTLTIVLLIANVALMSLLLVGNCNKRGACKKEAICEAQACDNKKVCTKGDKQACKKDCKKPCCTKKCPTFFSKLDLDSTQQVAFAEQASHYKAEISAIRSQIKENMKLYFSDLKTTAEASDKESLMAKIQALQKQKIEITYAHFETLKSLLKEHQMKSFDTHVEKAMKCILAKAAKDETSNQNSGICHKEDYTPSKKG